MNKIKILISTDSAALNSGLADTTRNIFIPLIQKYPNKYEIHQLGFFHFHPKEQIPWPIYQTKVNHTPNGPQMDHDDKYGEKSFDEVVAKVKPDIVFGYGDMWHFMPTISSVLRNSYRLLTYYTIDGQPYYGHLEADGTTAWGANLSRVDQVVVLSNFGKDTLKRSCKELKEKDIKVMYHPLEMQRFPKLSAEQKKDLKLKVLGKTLGDPENIICGFVGRNQFRKQNYKLWEAAHYVVHGDYIKCNDCGRVTTKEWDHSARKTRDSSELTIYEQGYNYSYCWYCKSNNIRVGTPNRKFYLWMHTPKTDPGYNIELQQRIWSISENCIYSPNPGQDISKQDLIKIMNCFDIGLMLSGGEGFNNPSAEMMACSVPLVFSNYSSHAEFSAYGGLPVRVTYIPEIHHGIMRAAVDNNHVVEQLLKLIESPELRNSLGEQGRNYISTYNTHTMVDKWDSIFTDMMNTGLPIKNGTIHGGEV